MLLRILIKGCFVGLVVFSAVGVIGYLARAHVYMDAKPHPQTWKEYVFSIVGGLDAAAEADTASVMYAVVVRLLAALFIGGLVTSLFCALAERIGDMKRQGLLPSPMRGHYIVAGFGPRTVELVRTLLEPPSGGDLAVWNPSEAPPVPKRRRVLVCTGLDVERARVALGANLPPSLFARVSFVSGDLCASGIAADSLFQEICLSGARQLYVLGDSENGQGEIGTILSFARNASDFLNKASPLFAPVPVLVRLSESTPFATYSHLFPLAHGSGITPAVHLVPIVDSEGWARRIWGSFHADAAFVPDFAPLIGSRYVHVVVAGFTDTGRALLQEAIRVCHYTGGGPTRITVIDPDPGVRQRFLARHASIDLLPDIRVNWMQDGLESENARDLLRSASSDENCLLTIAVCLPDDDAALEAALSLPEEVYRHRMAAKPETVRERYRENAPRILVRQRTDNPARSVADNPRFQFLRPFGMATGGLAAETVRETFAMLLNMAYEWPAASMLDDLVRNLPTLSSRIAEFRKTWSERLAAQEGVFGIPALERALLLKDVLAKGGASAISRFRIAAFRSWLGLPPLLRRANIYAPDGWGVLLRSLGLLAERQPSQDMSDLISSNAERFREALSRFRPERPLSEAEHNRWMADRILFGYRPPRPGSGEVRDDDFLYHPDLVPFKDLSADNVGKDDMAILSIPVILALEGFRLRSERNDNP